MTEPFAANLVIVHTPGAQQISDWLTVKETITAHAPEIEIAIVENGKPHPEIDEWQASRPSLVFSPSGLRHFKPAGGKVYAGRAIDKLEQVRRFDAAGIPTPRSTLLTPDLHLDAAGWGAYVLVKPRSDNFWGGMLHRLARPETINSRYLELTKNGSVEMLVQTLIDTRDEAGCLHAYRVLTIFGRPLYCNDRRQLVPRPPLTEIHDHASNLTAHNAKTGHDGEPVHVEITTANDQDVLELAVRATAPLSEIPVLALDIVRERSTGKLYVLEANPRGQSWHLSSNFVASREPAENRRRKYEQFGALDIVADALIERTRREAI